MGQASIYFQNSITTPAGRFGTWRWYFHNSSAATLFLENQANWAIQDARAFTGTSFSSKISNIAQCWNYVKLSLSNYHYCSRRVSKRIRIHNSWYITNNHEEEHYTKMSTPCLLRDAALNTHFRWATLLSSISHSLTPLARGKVASGLCSLHLHSAPLNSHSGAERRTSCPDTIDLASIIH